MNKKGFTLIELLAIIVILAIIAVITVPLILGIIEDAKINSTTDSAHGYKNAIQNYSMYLQTVDSTDSGLKGSYTVTELKTAGLEVKGKEPDAGIILIDNDGISGCLEYDEYASHIYNNEIINTSKGKCPTEKLVTTGDGLYKSETDPGRLIYRGANPNNRIFLKEDGTNNTLYRIVSYETDGTIKIVRDEKLSTNIAWDSANARKSDGTNDTYCTSEYGCNVWGNQETMLHNGLSLGDNFHYFYYESPNATTLSEGPSGKVGNNSKKEASLNEYLNKTWLTNYLSNYIDNHSWNVGGIYYTPIDKGILKEKEEEKQFNWIGKIGLLNITEYAESSTNSTCTSVKSNYSSSSELPCKEENWAIYNKNYHQWSISPILSNGCYRLWYVNASGYFIYTSAYSTGVGVRPAFYLKSGTDLTGNGASGTEYTIN